jgi:hypothetical protein
MAILTRPDLRSHVEHLDTRKGNDHDTPHAPMIAAPDVGSKASYRTISASGQGAAAGGAPTPA